MDRLFSPYQLKKLTIRNRIVLPPLVRFGWSDERGLVSERHLQHYERIAKAGTGLIIVEATCVAENARLSQDQLGLWEDAQIPGMHRLAERCQTHGATTLIQLHHDGFKRKGREIASLSLKEIQALQDSFVLTAGRAKEAGFDGIELHGAHGFLLSQMLSPVTNRRTDAYGGELADRARFSLELVERVRPLIDDHFILAYRMGANAPALADGLELAQMLQEAGVDLLDVSHNGGGLGERPSIPQEFDYSWVLYVGSRVYRAVETPVIVVMGIRTPEQARAVLEENLADFVAIGRGHLADPDWAQKARQGLPIDRCRECERCFWFDDGNRCPARMAASRSS
jgi:2,4-dienoyl-CoA reductase-like NADH-dependent reductase (Old Yellow Enzyme family)